MTLFDKVARSLGSSGLARVEEAELLIRKAIRANGAAPLDIKVQRRDRGGRLHIRRRESAPQLERAEK